MNLDESQRKKVAEWIAQGQKLSEIQTRLNAELGLRLTYMEARLLVDDLKLTPKDVEAPKPAAPSVLTNPAPGVGSPTAPRNAGSPAAEAAQKPVAPAAAPGQISVSVDQITRAGAVVSGKVTFSDGMRAEWYLDQTGRLGLAASQAGYRPSAADVQQFQMALETELSKIGF